MRVRLVLVQRGSDLDSPEEAGAEVERAEEQGEELEEAHPGGGDVQPLLQKAGDRGIGEPFKFRRF